jgi:5-(carboxyamino)imidazole ribonucleotide synthase
MRPTVGMVGAGQLARMTYEAAVRLDVGFRVLARHASDAAAQVVADVELGSPDDVADLRRFAAGCDVVTFDHELVALAALRTLEADGYTVRPPAGTLEVATNKRRQRELLTSQGFPLPPHQRVEDPDGAAALVADGPVVLKAASGGYDGRGVWAVTNVDDARTVVRDATAAGIELLAEPRLPLDCELTVLVARRPSGDAVVYPVVETIQVEGICHEVLAPARVDPTLAEEAAKLGLAVADAVGSVGMLAVEMFVSGGEVLLNELAARPHNSGHLTIEASTTSQFENHLRAVLDLPLGHPLLAVPAAAMVNVIGTAQTGDPWSRMDEALAVEGAGIHLYGKEPRPGRKIGHVTATGDDLEDARARARRAAEILAGGEMGGPR